MTTRRKFIRNAGAALAALSSSASFKLMALPETQTQLRRKIPGTDESLPLIGFGNSPAFRSNDIELSTILLEILLEYGGGYVDLGGSSRTTVNKLVHQMHATDAIFCGNSIGADNLASASSEIRALQVLQGGGPLDLVSVYDLDFYLANANMYRSLQENGLTRYVGVARSGKDHHATMMKLISDGAIDFVQTNYSMFEPEAADRLLPLAQDKGVAVLVNRPFMNGRYFPIVKNKPLPEWAAEFDCHSWAQFSLKFIASHPAVTSVLTETGKPKHARDNLSAGVGRLPDEKTRLKMLQLMKNIA